MAKSKDKRINGGMKLDGDFVRQLFEQLSQCQNAVAGFAELVGAEVLSADQQEYLSALDAANTESRELVFAALELSEMYSGKLIFKSTEFLLEELFSEICSILQPQAAKKGLEFAIMYSKPIPARIRSDRGILRDCLLNLAGDAIDSVEGGHVHITVGVENQEANPTCKFSIAGCSSSMYRRWCMATDAARIEEVDANFDSGQLRRMVTVGLAQLLCGRISVAGERSDSQIVSLVVPTDIGSTKRQGRSGKKLTEAK